MAPLLHPLDALSGQMLLKNQGEEDFGVHVEAGEYGRLFVGSIMRVSRASGRIAWF